MLDKERLINEANKAVKWIKDFVENARVKGVVIGNSGGKDSATVLAMAVKALGSEKVIAVSMPCHSINTDYNDAKLVAKHFNVKMLTVDLTETYDAMEKEINNQLKNIENKSDNFENTSSSIENKSIVSISKDASINMKPRLRMTTLYSIAQTMGYLVIGTGNLCEAMVGYTTKWGDSSYDFNPIANFTVEEVLAIGEYLGVPEKILKKAPNDGLGGQTDEEKMGIKYSQIAEMIETGKTDEMAEKEIIKRYNASKHKREAVPVYTFERKNYLKDRKPL